MPNSTAASVVQTHRAAYGSMFCKICDTKRPRIKRSRRKEYMYEHSGRVVPTLPHRS